MDLIQSFRVEASKLLGMLDVSNSTVARLKVLPAKFIAYFCMITLLYFLLFLLQEKYFTLVCFKLRIAVLVLGHEITCLYTVIAHMIKT